jgi:PAS domain S-box-containing protein
MNSLEDDSISTEISDDLSKSLNDNKLQSEDSYLSGLLIQDEATIRSRINESDTALILINKHDVILCANEAFYKLVKCSSEINNVQKWPDWFVINNRNYSESYLKLKEYSFPLIPNSYEVEIMGRDSTPINIIAHQVKLPSNELCIVSILDNSEFLKQSKQLQCGESEFRVLLENTHYFLFSMNPDGSLININKSMTQTYGYSFEELLKTNLRNLIDSKFHDYVSEKIFNNADPNTSFHQKVLTRTKNGDGVWIEINTQPIFKNGELVVIQGIARNITEWISNLEELQDSKQRFKEVADLIPGLICDLDMNFNITYVNQKALNIYGYTQDDIDKGINVTTVIPPEYQKQFANDMYNIFHGDFGNPMPYALYRKDGSLIHVLSNSAPIYKNGVAIGIRICQINVTDKVVAEEKLRISEEKFRTIYAESPLGIALFNDAGEILDHNRSFSEMFSQKDNPQLPAINLFTSLNITSKDKAELKERKVIVCESIFRNGDKVYHFEWHVTQIGIQNYDSSTYFAQVQNITEKKAVHEANLRKEREATERAEALVAGLRKELREKASFHNMVSRSPQMKQIFDIIPEVANASATVLVNGDSGTGKELIARSLHELSQRKNKPFVAINCSALPDNLLESELFGYKAGAFTDAKKDKPGKFAQAEGGTIFLDEIGDISAAMQVKLLRVLQERVYEPLGATTTVKSNVRVIAATNKDLSSMVNKNEFREDLFYRINIVSISLPPLKDRRCDIPILCEHFIDKFNSRYEKDIKEICKDALSILLEHSFPGNIRELENVIEHAFIFCKGSTIELHHLPTTLRTSEAKESTKILSSIKSFDELEKMYLKSIIEECGGNKLKASQKLGIHKATLFRKLKQLNMKE